METMTRNQVNDAKDRLERALRRRAVGIGKEEYNARRGLLDGEFEGLLNRIFPVSDANWPCIASLPKDSVKADTTRAFSWVGRAGLEERVELIRDYAKRTMGTDRLDVVPFEGCTDLPLVLTPAPHRALAYWQTLRDDQGDPGRTLVAGSISGQQYFRYCLELLEGHPDLKMGSYLRSQETDDMVQPDPVSFEDWQRFASGRAAGGCLVLYELPFSPLRFDYQGKAYSVPLQCISNLLRRINALAGDLVCLAFLLAGEPWMKGEILSMHGPWLDMPATQVWNTIFRKWTDRPHCYGRDGWLWYDAAWGDIAFPAYASLAFRPGVPPAS